MKTEMYYLKLLINVYCKPKLALQQPRVPKTYGEQ